LLELSKNTLQTITIFLELSTSQVLAISTTRELVHYMYLFFSSNFCTMVLVAVLLTLLQVRKTHIFHHSKI
jgi:hypothetical protein